jgi:hypothetical protein
MSHGFKSVAMLLLLPGLCLTQSLTSADALDRDLARSRDRRQECSGLVFAVQIEDSLPKLRKQGSVSGLKLVSQTGQIVCRGLEFTGDSIVKTALIARFLAHEWSRRKHPAMPRSESLSTFNHNLSYCYDASRAIRWVLKQARTASAGRRAVLRIESCRHPASANVNCRFRHSARVRLIPLWIWGSRIRKFTRRSLEYVRHHYGKNRLDPHLYDLMVNSYGQSDAAVRIILLAMEADR